MKSNIGPIINRIKFPSWVPLRGYHDKATRSVPVQSCHTEKRVWEAWLTEVILRKPKV